MRDYWNIADIIVIGISIAFVLLDLTVSNNSSILKGILKIRGVFRLLRVFILIRKLNVVRIKREIRQKSMTSTGYDLRSPLEKVLEILNDVRDSIDPGETKMIQDMNYCIKMIASNKLYEAELDLQMPEDADPEKSSPEGSTRRRRQAVVHRDVVSWYNTFSA